MCALVSGCGRSDTVLFVDTDHEGTSFSYEDTADTETETDTDTEGGVCGDGILDSSEDCDDGNGSNEDECTNQCQFNVCGDGFLFPELEECDPGEPNIGPGQACVPGCQINVCGDGFNGPGEQCDDGNPFDGDGCNSDCTTGSCGNAIVDPGEDCDDANGDNSDACLDTCVWATCGDGFLRLGFEECDEGAFNSDDADCTSSCAFNVCGDGNKHATDEECDPGAGNIGPGMMCLDGCVLNGCGDGDPGPDEGCDDGNADNTDACTTECLPATCGDGFVWAGNEECDDQNANDDDACHNDCSRTEIVQVAMGGNHTCARFDHGKLICWGNGDDGRTGYATEDNLGDDEFAGSLGFVDTGAAITSVVTGISHTCASYAGGQVRCWGRPTDGQLGYGNITIIGDDEVPSSVGFVDLGAPVTLLATEGGSFHTCAVLDNGSVVCWGRENEGRLGYALGGLAQDVGDDETPAQHVAMFGPVQVGGTVTQIVTGFDSTCALLDDGSVRCWGEGSDGALGYGNTFDIGDDETPASAGPVPVGGTVTQLGAGWDHVCAILDTNEVKCWGKGNDGRLGYGTPAWVGVNNTPADVGVVDVGGTPVEIDAGLAHTCVLLDDATIRCWGWGARGQLGYGNVTNIGDNELPSSAGPVEIGGDAVDVFVDGTHTCAIRDDGRVLCWGDGGQGRLGYASEERIGDDELPASVGALPLF
jgi:cysteine-rich repeat protein